MTTADAFLADIIARPDDDTPRLIFADWLTDNGEPEQAEFIRVQCELEPLRIHPFKINCPVCWHKAYLENRQDVFDLQRVLLPLPPGEYIWRRGFVHTVRCTCAGWLERGPAIVRQQPVQRVQLSDRKPLLVHGPQTVWGWLRNPIYDEAATLPDEPWLLPFVLHDLLLKLHSRTFFDSEAIAVDALSAACLRYAREMPC